MKTPRNVTERDLAHLKSSQDSQVSVSVRPSVGAVRRGFLARILTLAAYLLPGTTVVNCLCPLMCYLG